MSLRQQRIQTLYEISLAIRPRKTLETTADRALAAYLQKLNCSVGAVFRTVETADDVDLDVVASIPSSPERNELFRAASDELTGLVRTSGTHPGPPEDSAQGRPQNDVTEASRETSGQSTLAESLPIDNRVADTGEYHLMELPGFGVVVLGKRGGTVDPEIVSSLTPLNEKLARACRSNLTERQLREQRNRFEAVFAAIPEPMVNVVVEDGSERIVRANEAFKETFHTDGESLHGRDLNDLIVPDGHSPDTESLVEALSRGDPFENDVQRNTATGKRHFLFSGVPIPASEQTEYFGVYVDITEQKERVQTLEKLYDAAQDLFAENSRQQVCARAIETAESVLKYSTVGIHLYHRESEALEPVAVSDRVEDSFEDGPAAYTDRETVVWQVYEDSEHVRIDDTRRFEGTLPNEDTPARSAVVLPVGVHGVLITSAFESDAFEDRDVYFLRLLSQLVEIALDQAGNEAGLTAVQRAIREALRAETYEEMAEQVLAEIPDALDLPIAGIWKHQPTSQQLKPVAQTERAATLVGDQPVLSKGDSVSWEVFSDQTTSVIQDVSELDEAYNSETAIKGEITVPIGEFGVLTAGSAYKSSFSEFDAEVLEILATNLEAITEVIDSRQDIKLLDQVIARILRHDVRNKLTPMMGYANTIVSEAGEPISGYAAEIVEDCKELEQTAENAREMRNVVQNRDQMTTVSLATAVRAAAASVEQEFSGVELVSHISATPDVTAHPEFGTAIRHLIRNGFQHNDSETPRVEVVVEHRRDGLAVEVTDNGSGIDAYPLEVLERHGESALEHGSGVGLWIVDRIVKYSEAALTFETDGTGTVATITFPSDTDAVADG